MEYYWHSRMQQSAVAIVPHALSQQQYQDAHLISMTTSPGSQVITTTTSTQIQEAHSTTNHATAQPVTTVQIQENDGVTEQDKRAIYKHPLFPLMALLFEKCEQATQTNECPSSDSFDVDIQTFVHHQEQDRKPFFSEDSDLDNLMVKSIQVLRIHLLELEKVNDLCKDFCNRYINCLKGKLQSDNLLRIEGADGSPTLQNTMVNTSLTSGPLPQNQSQPALSMATLNQGQIVSGGTVYQMVQTPHGLVAQPIQIQSQQVQNSNNSHVVHGSTPLSQIGVPSTPVSTSNTTVTSPTLSMAPSSPDYDDDDYLGKKKSKRGVLPKQATQVMRSWLFQHIVHPYPTEDEKRQIAGQTNLSLLQVNNWFINARRRILQPMLDSSNPEQTKVKKSKPQNRPVQRFWPDNIANLAATATAQNNNNNNNTQNNTDTASEQQQQQQQEIHAQQNVVQTAQIAAQSAAQMAPLNTQMTSQSVQMTTAQNTAQLTSQNTTMTSQNAQMTAQPDAAALLSASHTQQLILPPGTIMTNEGQLLTTSSTAGTAAAVNLHLTSLMGQRQATSILMTTAQDTAGLTNPSAQNNLHHMSSHLSIDQSQYSDTSSSE